MTREAILAAAANFRTCLEALWPYAAQRGVPRTAFERHTAALVPDLRIMDFVDAQPEFTRTLGEYLGSLVSEERIAQGRHMLARHATVFDAVERVYGVDRHVLAAIWGVETKYGAVTGERPVLRSTATLACIGRRQNYFREEFLAALELMVRGDVRPDRFLGSWAGAFGATQFMPTAFRRYAVDFDGDGRRDIVDSIADAMASTANMLRRQGWRTGESWGYEVRLPAGFDYLLADRSRRMTVREWQTLGVGRADGRAFSRPDERAFLLLPAGARGPAFLMLDNFNVIMKYNPAEAYALAIGHLADRLRGAGPLVQAFPREERALTREERLELQQRLARRGYAVGEPDGVLGPKSRAAIRAFQTTNGLTPDGFASLEVLELLRAP